MILIRKSWTIAVWILVFFGLCGMCHAGEEWVSNPSNGHQYAAINCGFWTDCENTAVSLGGHLVTIRNQAEQDWLMLTFGVAQNYWIGFTDQLQEGDYVWISGENVTYTNWSPGEPNNMYSCGENWAVMNWLLSPVVGKWNDLGLCTQEYSGWGIVEVGGTLFPVQSHFGLTSNSGYASEPVNTALGNYTYEHMDLKFAGNSVLEFKRAYNSQDGYQGSLGYGWTHSYNIFLSTPDNQTAIIKYADGHEEQYTANSNGTFTAAHGGIYSSLVKNQDGTYTAKDKTQKVYIFGSGGKLSSIVDRNGNTISCSYSGSNLTSVTAPGGRTLSFSYDGSTRITWVTGPLGRNLSYAYDSNGNLSSYTDANGGTWGYQYDSAHHITSITNPRGKTLVANVYSGSQVVSQTNGRGNTTTFQYNTPNSGDTTITGPLGNKTIHTHDANYQLLKETDALGHFISYTYDTNGNRTKVTDKNGNSTQYTYDSLGNVTGKTDAFGKVTSISYDGMNNPLSVTEIAP